MKSLVICEVLGRIMSWNTGILLLIYRENRWKFKNVKISYDSLVEIHIACKIWVDWSGDIFRYLSRWLYVNNSKLFEDVILKRFFRSLEKVSTRSASQKLEKILLLYEKDEWVLKQVRYCRIFSRITSLWFDEKFSLFN